MPDEVLPGHPKQRLLFFVAQDIDATIRRRVEEFVSNLATLRVWINGPPQLVSTVEEPEDASRGDLPIETLGGILELYSALPPLKLPRDLDLQHLAEVSRLVSELREFSREHGLAFELELDGVHVGSIVDGRPDRLVEEGLLGEWRRQLEVH
jgi:hypothetical protein